MSYPKTKEDHFLRYAIIAIIGVMILSLIGSIKLGEILQEQKQSFEKFRDNASCIELKAYLIENVEYLTNDSPMIQDRYVQIDQLWKVKCQ